LRGTQTTCACAAYDTIAYRKPGDLGADLQHDTDVAIAKRQRLIQLAADGVKSREHPVGSRLVDYLRKLFGLLARLLQQAAAAEFHQHAFGAGGNQRAPRADQK
jgi:hypothetical protein